MLRLDPGHYTDDYGLERESRYVQSGMYCGVVNLVEDGAVRVSEDYGGDESISMAMETEKLLSRQR